jgi:hypothetical protein
MTTSTHKLTAAAGSVRFADERLVVQLVDGRELSVPLEWFPRLREASEAERTHWRLIGQGTGIHWPDVDEDISVPRLLGLPCE